MADHGPGPVVGVLSNPHAGSTSADLVAEVTDLIRSNGAQVLSRATASDEDAVRQQLRSFADREVALLVVIGGDGTVGDVISALLGLPPEQRPRLMIVPGGTGNSSYLQLWGHEPWRRSLAQALAPGARTARIDVARRSGSPRIMLLGISIGLIAEALPISRGVDATGRERYRLALEQAAREHLPPRMRIRVDGALVSDGPAVLANIGGGRYRGGRYLVLPYSQLDDGLLDVCVVGAGVDPQEVPGLLERGAHLDHPDVHYARGSTVTVEVMSPACAAEQDGEFFVLDGDVLTVDVVPAAIEVVVPPTTTDGMPLGPAHGIPVPSPLLAQDSVRNASDRPVRVPRRGEPLAADR